MESGYGNVQRILGGSQRLGSDDPARKPGAKIRHQRVTQLLIQRAGPQIVIGNHILDITGLIHHAVTCQIVRYGNLLYP
ncbi:Uncharacterised protein [Salmonella enterica subsp. enterica serovar Bovismorbificans]|uniref:Uncharacterized protein n=1 Tax=Salmonella enterica subsp. enterica serovar Bovismorbificans TaxID=58097 RepID=A0A655DQ50_SALET|nr:Uncharacterised protein [Salmonella enterica subsp. enterica serovar Bovismorbificans]